ncbi:MAG: microtubule-binding protein [Bdellovibrionales bacterium]
MSVIFLLLYVTSSLRSGTDGMTQALENQKLTREVEDLRTQLKAYDSIRKDYLNQQASKDESKMYEELMDRLTLLKEDAKDEKAKLMQAAQENEKKAQALNQYQQMVRNIINANVMAKTKIKTRENVIDEQDVEIDEQNKEIADLNAEVRNKQNQLVEVEEELKVKMQDLKSALKRHQMTKKTFDKKVADLKKRSAEQSEELRGQIAEAQAELQGKAAELANAQAQVNNLATEKQALEGQKQALEGQNKALANTAEGLKGDLAKARAEADARRAIARDIKKAFGQAGVKADVDERTGEVVLSFGEVYFATGSSNLKPQMKEILQKAMPAYAKSLLGNKKVSSKISAVEIIGFASPTYKGKVVNPKQLTPEVRKAVNYNLDLSYNRARSLFKYVFDEENMKFDHQKDMLPLIKVTGRSFLADTGRGPSGKDDLCDDKDCKKAQRVIIRFNFDDKK